MGNQQVKHKERIQRPLGELGRKSKNNRKNKKVKRRWRKGYGTKRRKEHFMMVNEIFFFFFREGEQAVIWFLKRLG